MPLVVCVFGRVRLLLFVFDLLFFALRYFDLFCHVLFVHCCLCLCDRVCVHVVVVRALCLFFLFVCQIVRCVVVFACLSAFVCIYMCMLVFHSVCRVVCLIAFVSLSVPVCDYAYVFASVFVCPFLSLFACVFVLPRVCLLVVLYRSFVVCVCFVYTLLRQCFLSRRHDCFGPAWFGAVSFAQRYGCPMVCLIVCLLGCVSFFHVFV